MKFTELVNSPKTLYKVAEIFGHCCLKGYYYSGKLYIHKLFYRVNTVSVLRSR